MKLLGALIILLTSTSIGFAFSKKYRERPRQLRQLKTALQSLEAEIMYGLTPIHVASHHLSEQLPKPISRFFSKLLVQLETKDGRSFQAIWMDTMEDFWPSTALKTAEKEIWSQFGQTLGQSDRLNQQKQIQLAFTHLDREEAEARIAQQQYEKLAKSLGVLGGLLLVLLLF